MNDDQNLVPQNANYPAPAGADMFGDLQVPAFTSEGGWIQWRMDMEKAEFWNEATGDRKTEMYVQIAKGRQERLLFNRGAKGKKTKEVVCSSRDGLTSKQGVACRSCQHFSVLSEYEKFGNPDVPWDGFCEERYIIQWNREYVPQADGTFKIVDSDKLNQMSMGKSAMLDFFAFQENETGKRTDSYYKILKGMGMKSTSEAVTKITIKRRDNAAGISYKYQHFTFAFKPAEFNTAPQNAQWQGAQIAAAPQPPAAFAPPQPVRVAAPVMPTPLAPLAPATPAADGRAVQVKMLFETLTADNKKIALMALGNAASIESADPGQALECISSLIQRQATANKPASTNPF